MLPMQDKGELASGRYPRGARHADLEAADPKYDHG